MSRLHQLVTDDNEMETASYKTLKAFAFLVTTFLFLFSEHT